MQPFSLTSNWLIPVDVVAGPRAPVETVVVVNRQRTATRQKFYVNKLGYSSTVADGEEIQTIASITIGVDAGAPDPNMRFVSNKTPEQ